MAYEFKLPDIGEGVVEGEIVRWLVKDGDLLALDQPMVEVMTDKATVEIPTPRAGRVRQRNFSEGQICPVGAVLVVIDEAGASSVKVAPPQMLSPSSPVLSLPVPVARTDEEITARLPRGLVGSAPPPRAPLPTSDEGSTPRVGVTSATVLATPATRKRARELGVNLILVQGSGPAGRITHDDVQRAHAAGALGPGRSSLSTALRTPPVAAASKQDVRVPFRGLRRKIAERMLKSKREAAHFTYVEEVDCTQLVALREKANARLLGQGIKLSYLPFIIKAVVGALQKFPQMNATLDEAAGEIVQRRDYHIGVAAATADGLIVPVLRDADRMSIVDLAREIERLSIATKAGRATRDELSGSTFTITSLGQLGGVLATPIINFPEVAILGIHKISKRPAAIDDKIVIRDMMNLSISVDHRLTDGYDAARFVADIKESLESPGLLFLESV